MLKNIIGGLSGIVIGTVIGFIIDANTQKKNTLEPLGFPSLPGTFICGTIGLLVGVILSNVGV